MNGQASITPLVEAAVSLHELFTGLCEGGFTEDQALRVVAYACATPRPAAS